ncbi:MAG TPA: ABC transporter permease, partial [Tepidisphaeraceae bacterium]
PLATDGIWTQTFALFVDAYRDLQSRKLFWLTLLLSVGVAAAFGSVGINEYGISIFGKVVRSPYNANVIPPGTFYKFLYTEFAIPYWLGFFAAILALIAVGGIFPDMIGSGSIELYLSRPIGRLRLFLTKYAFGLLFAALQVLLFSIASFFVIGLRSGTWEPGIFLSVPLVTLFFSYLYCVCVLIGIVTRSALAAILLTSLFWAALYVVHNTDMVLTTFSVAADHRVEQQKKVVEMNEAVLRRNEALPPDQRGNVSQFQFQRDRQKELLDDYEQTARNLRWWQQTIVMVKTPLPKTNETVELMTRWLVEPDPIMAAQQRESERREQRRAEIGGPATRNADFLGRIANSPEVSQKVYADLQLRKLGWVVGTSVAFEAFVLGIAAWIFCRRDY